MGHEEQVVELDAAHVEAPQPALRDVPGQVEADRQPQAPGLEIDHSEQDADQKNIEGADDGDIRIAEVGDHEWQREHDHRDPATASFG